uniref:Uncharacterized protein n=1 Tax=Rhizophora mucronata TaxID=61149 RepID=A0A2P2QG45_RHIMU
MPWPTAEGMQPWFTSVLLLQCVVPMHLDPV